MATFIGAGIGLGVGYFFGNSLVWIFIFLAFGLATETSLRTIKNVKPPPSPLKNQPVKPQKKILPPKKPPKHHF